MNNKIHTTIKHLRVEKGINQEQLAEALHVTRQAVSNWETGKTQPDIEMLTRIANFFEVSVERLIYGKDSRETSQTVKGEWKLGRIHLTWNYYPERMLLWGMMLATTISYVNWHSVAWALLHGLLNWGYVLYYVIRY